METTATLNPAPSPERRRRFNPFRAIGTALLFVLLFIRVLLRKILTVLVLLIIGLSKNKTAAAVGIVALALLLWSWSVGGVPWAPADAQQVAAAQANAAALPPSPYVQQFLKAQADRDAQGVWDSLSDEGKQWFRQLLAAQGVTLEQWQAQLTQASATSPRWVGATNVAATKLDDGKLVYLYIVTQRSSRGSGQVPYTFTTMPNGKILRFE